MHSWLDTGSEALSSPNGFSCEPVVTPSAHSSLASGIKASNRQQGMARVESHATSAVAVARGVILVMMLLASGSIVGAQSACKTYFLSTEASEACRLLWDKPTCSLYGAFRTYLLEYR